jgi:hypothetical protein
VRHASHVYSDAAGLAEWLRSPWLGDAVRGASAVLVQVYAADADDPALRTVLQQLREALPGAAIVGASTVGELADGCTLTERIVIGLSTFESTTVQGVVLPVQPGMEAVAASEAACRVLAGGGGVRAALYVAKREGCNRVQAETG